MNTRLPRIALTLGDPAGVGPEIVARLVSHPELMRKARVVLVGDRWLWEKGQRIAQVSCATTPISSFSGLPEETGASPAFLAIDSVAEAEVVPSKAGVPGGRSVLHILRQCLQAGVRREIDAICFAPLNKLAMKMAGLEFEDEVHFFAHELGVRTLASEINVLGGIWTTRVSSHVPLREAAGLVTGPRIKDAARLLDSSLRRSGNRNPRIAVAGLNPHAGEGGTCGREEIDIIAPAVAELRSEGIDAQGPFPADTVFIKVRDGEYQGVVTMYHDQGQIALKLLGFGSGVTVQGGLPVVVTTPAHGTAYDIAGRNVANPTALLRAFELAAALGSGENAPESGCAA